MIRAQMQLELEWKQGGVRGTEAVGSPWRAGKTPPMAPLGLGGMNLRQERMIKGLDPSFNSF